MSPLSLAAPSLNSSIGMPLLGSFGTLSPPTHYQAAANKVGVPNPNSCNAVIGMDSMSLVKRHDKSGVTHGFPWQLAGEYFDTSVNTHITVGNLTMPINVLWQEYGQGMCLGSLMSLRSGNARFYCCDQAHDVDHGSLFSAAHNLPTNCGPSDKTSWNKCLRASGRPPPGTQPRNKQPSAHQNSSDEDDQAREKKNKKSKAQKKKKKK